MKYGSIDELASKIEPNYYLYVIDMKDAFLNWKVFPCDTLELGIKCPTSGRRGVYKYLPFGLSTAPHIHVRNVDIIVEVIKKHLKIELVVFMDDIIGGAPSEEEAWQDMCKVVELLIEGGIPLSTKPSGLRSPDKNQL